MKNIKNIAFDLGGVVLALSLEGAIRTFEKMGLVDARERLDAFQQRGVFADLESGRIGKEEFRQEMCRLIGREVTMQECYDAWHGYVDHVPQRNLDMLLRLRQKGYKVCLLSNTNPFMTMWTESPAFDGHGHPMSHYFDHLYLSYECGVMKPSPAIFHMMLEGQSHERPDGPDHWHTYTLPPEQRGLDAVSRDSRAEKMMSLTAELTTEEGRGDDFSNDYLVTWNFVSTFAVQRKNEA